jgi:hypothetical protein
MAFSYNPFSKYLSASEIKFFRSAKLGEIIDKKLREIETDGLNTNEEPDNTALFACQVRNRSFP